MTEVDWLTGTDWSAHVGYVGERLSPRRLRLLAAGFCRVASHLFDHPDLTDAIVLLEKYADGLISEVEAEKVRQQYRGLAQQAYERYRARMDIEELEPESDPSPRDRSRSEFAWAIAFAFNYNPVPVVEICTRVLDAIATKILGFKMIQDKDERRAEVIAEHSPAMRSVVWEVVGNPFRPVTFSPAWRTDTAVSLAKQMYESREFSAMPILADALQDAGCDNDDVLNHCRGEGIHFRGCWVVDGVLG